MYVNVFINNFFLQFPLEILNDHFILYCQIEPIPTYNERKYAKETARKKWVFILSELFYIAVIDHFNTKKSVRCRQVFAETEFVVSWILCV